MYENFIGLCFVFLIINVFANASLMYIIGFFFSDELSVIKSKSLIWYCIENNETYRVIYILFDFIYILKNFHKRPFYFLFMCVSILVLSVLLHPLVAVYLISLVIGIFVICLKYVKSLFGYKIEINFKTFEISPFNDFRTLLSNCLFLGYYHAFIIVYYVFVLKRKKYRLAS